MTVYRSTVGRRIVGVLAGALSLQEHASTEHPRLNSAYCIPSWLLHS